MISSRRDNTVEAPVEVGRVSVHEVRRGRGVGEGEQFDPSNEPQPGMLSIHVFLCGCRIPDVASHSRGQTVLPVEKAARLLFIERKACLYLRRCASSSPEQPFIPFQTVWRCRITEYLT